MARTGRTRAADIGLRRLRFALERPVEEADGAGGVVRRFALCAFVWGTLTAIAASSSAARDVGDRPDLAARYRVAMRWCRGIDGRSRLRLGERVFEVLSVVDPDGRRRELVIVVQEVTP
ncbi:head-tail adaptor protein [Pseudochelatococcus contaminans]|uniref:Head-tail adaptor n=1 Tax=Pseudochelatococcus contaminans TaxID=1538103 RepID=A0A7W5Z4J3_9HYPH|nr:head-tail adaptor protein [Pseudochelatococcus contaminans]MBB3809574.1 head-tail adaptor [Pseudochelatococcus contaminans]